ncbi:MAG: family 16 glycoside hydrolase [Planctomycetota bacterium]
MTPLRLLLFGAAFAVLALSPVEETGFDRALRGAELSLKSRDLEQAKKLIHRALERDPKSPAAWDLRARIAEAGNDIDEQTYSLHVELRLLTAQRAPYDAQSSLLKRIREFDPLANEFISLRKKFVEKFQPIADRYEKDGRPHSAIRAHQILLALDPERRDSEDAIQRISKFPDPSLAETAKPKDLLANISDEWIKKFDAEHNTWDTRAKIDRDNYTTYTDAGYAVLVRAAEAMEQMNAFYRVFFKYGAPGENKKIGKIEVHIFKDRDEYLKKGQGPPVEWSGGQFTGGAVETYVGDGGFEQMVTVLFHEAAHQFVSMATSAAGWLNEGLASYFEGTRILANGTVVMNLPANHRLFPLVDRMQAGWMTSASDGLDPANATKEPEKAPTFRIVLENKYAWGPPWYAPTWGVVYFLWNYQDQVDGRFVYRAAFQEFINASGGRSGQGAIENFEKVVLSNPSAPTPKVDPKLWKQQLPLPATVDELNDVWKNWMVELRDEQMGRLVRSKPYLTWARHALTRGEIEIATEHFEKGVLANPDDSELVLEFAKHLNTNLKNPDRASKLVLQVLRFAESKTPPDTNLIKRCDSFLQQLDGNYTSIETLLKSLSAAARTVSRRYLDAGYPMMAMDVSWRLASDLNLTNLYEDYEAALRKCGRSLALFKLAYNEKDLSGWSQGGNTTFQPSGESLATNFRTYSEKDFDFSSLTLDTVTLGDFSFETEVLAEPGKVNYCGILFGKKSDSNYHGFIYFPPRGTGAEFGRGYIDLTSFYGASQTRVWRHNPVKAEKVTLGTAASVWHKMRVDVAGKLVDVFFDDELVVTHEFPSVDVVRGGFGIVTGVGKAQFRNIRYLARGARDRAAQIERTIKLGDRAKGPQGDGGSWLGTEAPFPTIRYWLKNPRTSWREKGNVPTLLVFWSVQQNEKIPIDVWLNDVNNRYGPVGLEIMCIAMASDAAEIEKYLDKHPMPGSVALDLARKSMIGDSFTAYGIDKYGMPRVVLIDTDFQVVWEGDPGLKAGEPWTPGRETYLDAPLDELISKRNLKEVGKWRKDWVEKALPALKSGDFTIVAPLLKSARAMDASSDELVASAQSKLSVLESAMASIDTTARNIADLRCEPAVNTLIAWGKLIDKQVPAHAKLAVQTIVDSEHSRNWNVTVELVKNARSKMPAGKEVEVAGKLVDKILDLEGPFCEYYGKELRSLVGYSDVPGIQKWLASAEHFAGQWLAQTYFRW